MTDPDVVKQHCWSTRALSKRLLSCPVSVSPLATCVRRSGIGQRIRGRAHPDTKHCTAKSDLERLFESVNEQKAGGGRCGLI